MYLAFENPGTVKYEKKFFPGDKVKSLKEVTFVDGTMHRIGQIIEVKEGSEAYYNVMHEYYERVE